MIADAVVVGTGAGGGPAAALLAEAGLRVVVLEAGPRWSAADFTGDEAEMTARLWKFGMAGNSLALYAGACVGGSTVVNDALCFPTPPEILAHWRDDHGLTGLTADAWTPFVEQAWQDIHAVPTDRAHQSRNAEVLAVGAAKLGWAAGPTPRSVRDCLNLGLCNFGCPSNAKQSTLVAYVPRAERAGAQILAGARADRVRITDGVVQGVSATQNGQTLTVDAPLVCVAAGVLETPALLQRSDLRAGDGVAFHTSVHVTARCREPIHGYYGPTMGYAVTEFSDVAGHRGPGFMIENTSVMPVATATALPGFGAVHAERMAQLSYMARALVVSHDRTRGRVDADGTVTYELVPEDIERLRRGIRETTRAFLAAGVEEVWLPVDALPAVRAEADLAALDGAALSSSAFSLAYAVHLFGGAAMGSVCDEDGSVRGARGLYVCDASALPSNTGVNPQITIMANALRIASGIARRRA
jgi:choline dehydrogenase-like flavoprotein